MVKADIKEIYETIKAMLGYALSLSESPIPEMYELGHYLADNILTKICFAVAIDKQEEGQIYTSIGWTKSFPDLYKDHIKAHYAQVPDYDPDIKKFHEDRNVYQHKFDFFDRTMRQPRAKSYVDIVENIMRTVGIIKSGEIIRPSSLSSSIRTYDYSKHQIKAKEIKYQELYDLFKIKNDADIYIKFENKIKEIYDLSKILNMKSGISHGMRYFHNSKWDINISYHSVSIHSNELKQGYALNEPNQETNVLDNFLQYYRECCENVGMDINP